MTYSGNLYGKIGNRYIPLAATSQDVDRMEAELEKWRSLPAKVEALISQTNIPLSAAVVRTTAINQVLDLIDEIRRSENADNVRTNETAPD